MSFQAEIITAIGWMREGIRVQRKCWNRKMWICTSQPLGNLLHNQNKEKYEFTIADILATDWIKYNEEDITKESTDKLTNACKKIDKHCKTLDLYGFDISAIEIRKLIGDVLVRISSPE